MPYNIVTSQIGQKPIKDIKKDIRDKAAATKKKTTKPPTKPPAKKARPPTKPPAKPPKTSKDEVTKALQDNNLNLIASQVEQRQESYSDAQQQSSSVVQTGSNAQKPVSDTKSRGKQGQNNMPPGFDAPPPPSNTVFDIVGKTTEQKVAKQARPPTKPSETPPNTMSRAEYVQESYDVTQNIDKQLSKVQKAKQETSTWEADKSAAYYTIENFDPTLLHGPGATKETAIDIRKDIPGTQLTPRQTEIYMKNLSKQYGTAEKDLQAASIQSQKNYVDALNLPPGTKVKETKKGYEFNFTKLTPAEYETKKELKQFYEKTDPLTKTAHIWSSGMLSYEDPFAVKSLYYSVTGQTDKFYDTRAKATTDLNASLDKGLKSYAIKAFTGPTAAVGTAYVTGAGIGAGFGAAKAAFPVAGKIAGKIAETTFGVSMAGVAAKETIPQVQKAMKTGDYGNLAGTAALLTATSISGYKGYKTGHAHGYGRTEAYLYRKHTYKPGSVQDVQFKEAMKVARKLENVKSHKQKPLDIAKDIARMDKKSAAKTIEFLKKNPKTTIGGSAASYTQIEGARTPQDIDLWLSGNKKSVAQAKKFFGKTKTAKGEHLIDIHGKEMYKPGSYHQFGFQSKTPIKIKGTRYFKAGEQLFRKGVSAVKKETSYRHFKDVPDFIGHSKSLIKSGKQSWNPFTRYKARSAEISLQQYMSPKAQTVTPFKTRATGWIRKYTSKPMQPKPISSTGGVINYAYPKYSYPTNIGGVGLPVGYTSSYYPKVTKISGKTVSYPKMSPSTAQKTITYPKIKNVRSTPVMSYPAASTKPMSTITITPQAYTMKQSEIKKLTGSYTKKEPFAYRPGLIYNPTAQPAPIPYTTPSTKPKTNILKIPYPKTDTSTRYKTKKRIKVVPPPSTKDLFGKMPEYRYRFRKFDIPSLKKLLGS